jgi:hypothetical protein
MVGRDDLIRAATIKVASRDQQSTTLEKTNTITLSTGDQL